MAEVLTQPEKPPESMPPNTTAQEDLTASGQRNINIMWEKTQQIIAVSVTGITLAVCAYLVSLGNPDIALMAFSLLSNVFFLVIGTYFQRTNHTKVGGVGPKEVGR